MKNSTFGLVGVQKWNRQRAVFISLGIKDHRSHVRHLSSRMRKESQENGTLILYLCRCGVQTTDFGLLANSPFRGVQRSHVWVARQPRTPQMESYVARMLHRGAGHFFSFLYNRRK